MSKTGGKIDTKQVNIFDYLKKLSDPVKPASGGDFRVVDQLRESLRQAMKGCPLDRYQIAGEISHLVGETITKETLDSWTRESDEINGRCRRHIPAEFLPAFCEVTKSNEPLVLMGRLCGLFVLPGPEALRAEIQRLDEEIATAKDKKRKRMMFLKELDQGTPR